MGALQFKFVTLRNNGEVASLHNLLFVLEVTSFDGCFFLSLPYARKAKMQ